MDHAKMTAGLVSSDLQRSVDRLQLWYIHSIDDGPLDDWPGFSPMNASILSSPSTMWRADRTSA
jgi:hypothetical protein